MLLLINEHEYREGVLEITGARYHHLARVNRARVGDVIRAALPDGRIVTGEISEIHADLLRARVLAEEPARGVSPCRITLFQAVLKGEKMDLVVQKATELGVSAIIPLLARRSIPRWTERQAADRAERWQRIAESAAEQSERSLPPMVEVPRELRQTVDAPGLKLLLHERLGEALRVVAARHPRETVVALYLGPEGGWGDEETQLLLNAGAIPIHLGERILRAETASLTAISLAQYLWGDLSGPCS